MAGEHKRDKDPSFTEQARQRRLALLIDADNAQASIISNLLEEIANFGVVSSRRIYGDWTTPNLGPWKKTLVTHSITPIQQFANTSGKNSSDSALIIDAMDLMYTRRFDGMCIVSSDSDFTRLASRLREEGLMVLGFGEKKTPESFRAACDRFIYTEVLRPTPPPAPGAEAGAAPPAAPSSRLPPEERKRILDAIDACSDDDGWAHLGAVGSTLVKLRSDFDPRLFGFKKLSDLIRSMRKELELEERGSGPGGKAIFVRVKGRGP